MAELLLINPNTGKPYLTASKRIPKNAKAEDYLNILMLFVDYKKDGVVDQSRLDKERKAIVKKLFLTYPFNAQRDRVNIFTPKNQPDLGVVYSALPFEMDGFAFKKDLTDQIEKYSYRSFINNGDVWKWKSPYGTNRSESCIGIVSGNRDRARGAFFELGDHPEEWAENEGATSQLIGHFLVAQPDFKSIKGDRVSLLSNTFIHELGHSLSLADEYEFPIKAIDNGIWKKYSFALTETPNVISRNDLWINAPLVSAAAKKEGVFPAEGAIDPAKIPWERMLGDFEGASPIQKSKLLKLIKHKSRNISEHLCTGSDVNGKALTEGGPFKYNKTHGWCEKKTDEKLNPKTTKDASTELDIGLYEGGDTKSFDIFRPQRSCRMRYSEFELAKNEKIPNESYCWVCQKWILYRIKGPSERRTVINFKEWLRQDLDLLLAMELAIRNL